MAKFQTRARAVDMLGRQQIAGVPNAISELFKNAHDAYADQVTVDFFGSSGLFVLRDDGLGMTQEDFEKRWLTIGTESKVGSRKGLKPPSTDPRKDIRPITGEKGIGRLAIAVIGPQVLVLTRAKKDGQLEDLIAAFLHWGLFAAPGVNIDQIEIPVQAFPGGTLPSDAELKELIDIVRENVNALENNEYIEPETAENIRQDLKNFNISLSDLNRLLGLPSLLKNGHGTQFYILPAQDGIAEDLNRSGKKDDVSRIKKLLLGFGNTMVPEHEPPRISTALRYWRDANSQPEDMIADVEFFTPEEFESADHHLQGRFDEMGQFTGTISVYGNEFEHLVPWTNRARKPAACGPFQINVAYVPGVQRQSKMPPEEFNRLTTKLDNFGGLYIYKDGIRILPYGDNDVDFLNIERRRSEGAAYYFFSYRRMFGAIELTQTENTGLAEKAGREGFQDNRAFREFRAILENFLKQIAADFFREGGEHAQVFEETRNDLKRQKEAREQQEKRSRQKRKQFADDLESFFEKVNGGEAQEQADEITRSLESDIKRAAQNLDQIGLINAEVSANQKLAKLRERYKVKRPNGAGLTKHLIRDWNTYAEERERLEHEIFLKAQAQIQTIITEASTELKFALDNRERIGLLLNEIVVESRRLLRREIQTTRDIFVDRRNRFDTLAKQMNDALGRTTQIIEQELDEYDLTNKSPEEIGGIHHQWETRIDQEAQRYSEILKHLQAQLENINWDEDENGYLIGDAEITAALEEEVLALRDQVDTDVDLVQLGQALNIIDHEFSNTILAIRKALHDFKPWADNNPKLKIVYQQLVDSFTHLDSYLSMFTPLNRRLYRSATDIIGINIFNYLQNLFRERLKQYNVTLRASDAFRTMTIKGYPSSFYPVFVNLVDNAIFWLQDQPLPREVNLAANGNAFIVSDNGPGIPIRDRGAIFELGFTRKPGGRGMGLYISREVLKKAGFKLELDTDYEKRGTTFIISPINS